MSSNHVVNTAIGSGALWSSPTDKDNVALITETYFTINSSPFSAPLYYGQSADPAQQWQEHNLRAHSGDQIAYASKHEGRMRQR